MGRVVWRDGVSRVGVGREEGAVLRAALRSARLIFDFSEIILGSDMGPHQFPEKLIPLMIINAMRDDKMPVHGDGMNVRDWIHVRE